MKAFGGRGIWPSGFLRAWDLFFFVLVVTFGEGESEESEDAED